MPDAKIILLCSSDLAIPPLKELIFFKQLSAIITIERNTILQGDLKELTKGTSVPVITVNSSNYKKIIEQEIQKHQPEAVLIISFPYRITKELLSLAPKGFINFHYGKLPEYRGPEPIFNQLVMQEEKPGVTVHVVTEGIDEGPVILKENFAYDPDDTYGILKRKLADSAAKLVGLLLKILSFGNVLPAVPQDESKAGYQKKPTAATLMINWQTMDAAAIKALVNACNPWNKGCGAAINGRLIGFTEVEIMEEISVEKYTPGTIIKLDAENGLQVASSDCKILKINVFYTEEGFMSGKKLINFGVIPGDFFK